MTRIRQLTVSVIEGTLESEAVAKMISAASDMSTTVGARMKMDQGFRNDETPENTLTAQDMALFRYV